MNTNKKPAHTPGPWSIQPRENYVRSHHQGAEYTICSVNGYEGDEGQANARLIAAAPDMKNELFEVAQSLDWMAARLNPPDNAQTVAITAIQMRERAAKIRAAIAKAEGK